MIFRVLADLLQFYLILIFVRIILSWIPIDPWSKAARATHTLERVTDPVLVPVRKVVPPVRLGGMALDLSPFIVLVALTVVIGLLHSAS